MLDSAFSGLHACQKESIQLTQGDNFVNIVFDVGGVSGRAVGCRGDVFRGWLVRWTRGRIGSLEDKQVRLVCAYKLFCVLLV